LWFNSDDIISVTILRNNKELTFEMKLELRDMNISYYYNIFDEKKIFYCKSGLTYSILTKSHLDNLYSLDISHMQIIKIFTRCLYQQDLFTVYLANVNYSKIPNQSTKYIEGDIIIKFNNKSFSNYNEFTQLMKEEIKSFTTIDLREYFI
jgi:hypothetical protein